MSSIVVDKKIKMKVKQRSGFLLRSPSLQKIKCSANRLQGDNFAINMHSNLP